MEGLYLYCIRKINNHTPFSVKGFDQKNEILVMAHKEIEAVVSPVSLEEFNPEELKRTAQENFGWIKEKIIAHDLVLKEAMKSEDKIIGIVPMKFGTIFTEKKRLIETMDERYEQFKTTLNMLEGKQEWSIKIYLTDKKKLEEKVKAESEKIKKLEKKIADLSEGFAYFHEAELKEVAVFEMERKIKKIKYDIFEAVKLLAVDAKECKILEREITGKAERMIFNSAFLIKTEAVEKFIKSAERINNEINMHGLALEYSGPWPPYYFCEKNG